MSTQRLWITSQYIAEFALLTVFVGGALLAIAEMGTREAFAIRIETQLAQARTDAADAVAALALRREIERNRVAELSGLAESDPTYAAREALATDANAEADEASQAATNARGRVLVLSSAETYLENTSALGISSTSWPLRRMMLSVQSRLAAIDAEELNIGNPAALPVGFDIPEEWSNSSAAYVPVFFERLRNEHLLAIAVVAAAVLGSLLAAVRSQDIPTVRTVTLGAATGFIVFLMIKGGHHVFLIEVEQTVSFNPYSAAFAGLIAGLFSDIAYGVLGSLVRDLARRVKGAFDPPSTPQEPSTHDQLGPKDSNVVKISTEDQADGRGVRQAS